MAEVTQLHSGVFTSDSVAGVPFTEHPDCDTCRVSYALAEVDSIRVGHPERGLLEGTGVVLGGILVLGIGYCALRGCSFADR